MPGLGPRSARRAALHLIKKREQLMGPLSHALGEAYDKVKVCSRCGNVDTNALAVCTDERRDQSVIIVVEDVSDLWALERGSRHERRLSCAGRNAFTARWRRA